jgi:hypothetical protein
MLLMKSLHSYAFNWLATLLSVREADSKKSLRFLQMSANMKELEKYGER